MCRKLNIFRDISELTNIGGNVYRWENPNGKDIIYKVHDFRGYTAITYQNHNEFMGTSLIKELNFITPNMPKLYYAFNFTIRGTEVYVNDLNPMLQPFNNSEGYFFIKRDGFNLLFYEFNGEIIMKTRLLPEASPSVRNLVKDNLDYELEKVEELVKDGFIPIFEVWGETLRKYDLVNGGSNVKIVKELEKIDHDPIMDLIVLRYNDGCEYPFVDTKTMISISKQYGLTTPPFEKNMITLKNIKKYMNKLEELNNNHETIVYEGLVLHVYDLLNNYYGMFKIKPPTVLIKDVIFKNPLVDNFDLIINKVSYEVSKILLDYDPVSIIVNDYDEVIQQLREYLNEDINNKLLEKVMIIAERQLMNIVTHRILTEGRCKEVLEKVREKRKNGYTYKKSNQVLINQVLGECRNKGYL